jgi:hypothetical protein
LNAGLNNFDLVGAQVVEIINDLVDLRIGRTDLVSDRGFVMGSRTGSRINSRIDASRLS